MISAILIFFGVYTLVVAGVILFGYFLQIGKEEKLRSEKNRIDLSEVEVLVPFRNEKNRIHVLLDSLRKVNSFPGKITFIDDHSTDGGAELIKQVMDRSEVEILRLPEGVTGKKQALRYAIERSNARYILTMDADVYFDRDYFDTLAELPPGDMYVMLAIMKAKKGYEHLFEVDLVLANAVNTGLSGIARPIVASGANLFYDREAFNEVDDLASHQHAASGDDTYLLRDFREKKRSVALITNPKNAVYTETPQSIREFFDQRLRWVGKTKDVNDSLGTGAALVQFVLTLFFFGLLAWNLALKNWDYAIYLFFMKTLADMIFFFPFFNRTKRLITWSMIPLYELIFPFYSLAMFVLMCTYKPKWKGREIYSDK